MPLDARSGGAVRRLAVWHDGTQFRRSAQAAGLACPWPARDASWIRDTTPQLNTHSNESREIHYRWHPWFGRRVWIYSIRTGRAPASVRCGLEPIQCSKSLEVPLWMFEAASCSTLSLTDAPRVGCAALQTLRALLQNCMLQDRHHSVLLTGGADASPIETLPARATGIIPSSVGGDPLAKVAEGHPRKNSQPAGEAAARTLEYPAPSQSSEGGPA